MFLTSVLVFIAGMTLEASYLSSADRILGDEAKLQILYGSTLVVVFITGLILLTGANERRGLPTPMFQLKMVLMVISILITAALQLTLQSDASFWELSPARRIGAKLIAPLCLFMWMFTVCTGRWLAYGYVIFPNG